MVSDQVHVVRLLQDTYNEQSSPWNYSLVRFEYLHHSVQDQNTVVQSFSEMYKRHHDQALRIFLHKIPVSRTHSRKPSLQGVLYTRAPRLNPPQALTGGSAAVGGIGSSSAALHTVQVANHCGTDANLAGDGLSLTTAHGMGCGLVVSTLNRTHSNAAPVL